MAQRLKKQCYCHKIFVSDGTTVNEPTLARDSNGGPLHFDGNTQGNININLVATTKKIRLCVIDYAGLSTDPIVIQRMLRLNKNIKELVVVHQSKIEVLTRYDLKDPIVAKKFACRTGPVHQSK
ncbi:hypothetical protein DFQ28_006918 [Apophysomyces sp. BC1034]|nr:hypothetical protein DFQ28_006918 [Apophysomyces sp. BC1034]